MIKQASRSLRCEISEKDIADMRRISERARLFTPEELERAECAAREAIYKGEDSSGYSYIFCYENSVAEGYSCFGPIPCTDERFKIYTLLSTRRELSEALLAETEKHIRNRGGKRVYIDVPLKDEYQHLRDFYRCHGYIAEARLENYFSDGEGKVIYAKVV